MVTVMQKEASICKTSRVMWWDFSDNDCHACKNVSDLACRSSRTTASFGPCLVVCSSNSVSPGIQGSADSIVALRQKIYRNSSLLLWIKFQYFDIRPVGPLNWEWGSLKSLFVQAKSRFRISNGLANAATCAVCILSVTVPVVRLADIVTKNRGVEQVYQLPKLAAAIHIFALKHLMQIRDLLVHLSVSSSPRPPMKNRWL